MLRLQFLSPVLAGALLFVGQAQAQVSIRTPFAEVHTSGSGGVHVRAPFVNVSTGGAFGGVNVQAPFVNVDVPPSYPVYSPQPPVISVPQQPVPVDPNQPAIPLVPQPGQSSTPVLPPPTPLPSVQSPVIPGPIVHAPGKALTHYEFAQVFKPIPGKHVVRLIHPGICKKCVDVCFELPPGCPRVHVHRRSLEFDYGHHRVEICFALFGRVRVEYD